MGTIFTPQYVQQLAADLGVQLALEWTVPYALASASLPEGWSYVNNEDGVVSYINQNRYAGRKGSELGYAGMSTRKSSALRSCFLLCYYHSSIRDAILFSALRFAFLSMEQSCDAVCISSPSPSLSSFSASHLPPPQPL